MSQHLHHPSMYMMPMTNQGMLYYNQNPPQLVNQFVVYHNQKDTVSSSMNPTVTQNNVAITTAGNSHTHNAHPGDISYPPVNYMLMHSVPSGKVLPEMESAQNIDLINNASLQNRNLLTIMPNTFPVAMVQRGVHSLPHNPKVQMQMDSSFLQGSFNMGSHQGGALLHNGRQHLEYQNIGKVANPRIMNDISANQLYLASFNNNNKQLLPPHSLQKTSDFAESYSYSQTRQEKHCMDEENISEVEEYQHEHSHLNQEFASSGKKLRRRGIGKTFQNQSSNQSIVSSECQGNQISNKSNTKQIIVKEELVSQGNQNFANTKLVTQQPHLIKREQKNTFSPSTSKTSNKASKLNKKRSLEQSEIARTSIASTSTVKPSLSYQKMNHTKIEETDHFLNQPSTQSNSLIKNDYAQTQFNAYMSNQQNSNYESAQNSGLTASGDNQEDLNASNQEFSDSSSQLSSSDEDNIQDSPLVKKYCKFASIQTTSSEQGSQNCSRKSEIIIVCSLKPKEKVKKSKQDYYNDSNYTKNLLKGFRRYMKRYSADQQSFQEFERFFDNHLLNNELILKLFAHDEYSGYFNKFLSQPPLWWIQEAKIKDVEKQIGFFNICRSRKFNSIKTKRKSFLRPLI